MSENINRRNFLKTTAVGGALLALASGTACSGAKSAAKTKSVVIGGGAAGLSTAAHLMRRLETPDITVIDPSDTHYYQPGFTLIAGGVYQPDDVYKPQAECIPHGVKWVKDSVVVVDPDRKLVKTQNSGDVKYDFLVLTPGLVLRWDWIEGIDEASLGQGNAHCIYCHSGAVKTAAAVREFVAKGGKGIYIDTYTKHKCGGAPKKICLMTEHLARKRNRRDALDINFYTASKQLYDVPYFTPRLLEIYKERNVKLNTSTRVAGIDTAAKRVKLDSYKDGKVVKSTWEDYDFLHFLPPMSAPLFVPQSGLSITEGKNAAEGWSATDKYTLVHKKYPDIISLGDVAGIPTSKTSAAIRKQVPIAVENLILLMEGKAPEAKYDGYAACPIITDYGHLLMCEFDYQKNRKSSFPFSLMDMSKESRLGWLLKVYALKPLYFYGMLNGLA